MGLGRIFGGIAIALSLLALKVGLSWSIGGALAADRAPAGPPVEVMRRAGAPEQVRLRRRGDGHFYVHGLVNGQVVEFLVDTGATSVVLTTADAERVGLVLDKDRFDVIGRGASGAVEGQVDLLASVEVEGRIVTNLDAMVADGLEQSLLGQDFLGRLGAVDMSGDVMVLR
jgi:aspartyl protease family protein